MPTRERAAVQHPFPHYRHIRTLLVALQWAELSCMEVVFSRLIAIGSSRVTAFISLEVAPCIETLFVSMGHPMSAPQAARLLPMQ